jgi:hypothetical protein
MTFQKIACCLAGSLLCLGIILFTGCTNAGANSLPGSGASFSAIVDGTKFSSNTGTDNLNAAFHIKGDNGIVTTFFMLADPENPVQKLNFELPEKTGSTTIRILPKYSFEGYVTGQWTAYLDDGVTVNVTTYTATRIAGTFSGSYKLENPKGFPNAKPEIQITDGKFDIPFSTSASWKKVYHAQ